MNDDDDDDDDDDDNVLRCRVMVTMMQMLICRSHRQALC